MNDRAGAALFSTAQALVRAAKRLARGRLAEFGLNDQRTALIVFLYRQGPQTLIQVAERLDLQKTAVAALLSRMSDDGLVLAGRRGPEAIFSLTEAGRALVKPIKQEILAIRAAALEGVTARELEITNAVLLRAIGNLRRSDGA